MQPLRSMLIQAFVVAVAGGLVLGAHASTPQHARAVATPPSPVRADEDARDAGLARFAQPRRSQARCRQVALAQATDAGPSGSPRMDLGGTHCRWVCYPGSGCEYLCQFFPE